MRIYTELRALESSPSLSLPFLAGIHSRSQISTQRPSMHLEIVYRILLCVSPLICVLWNLPLHHHRCLWPTRIRLLRYGSNYPRLIWKLVVSSHYAYIRRIECSGIVSFDVAAVSGRHPFTFSDIDPAILDTPRNYSLQPIMCIAVEMGALELSPLLSPPSLVGAHSSSQI